MNPHAAVDEGDLALTQELVTTDNLEQFNMFEQTVLHRACLGGYKDITAWLIRLGANVNARTSSGATPLLLAAYHIRPCCVQLLLEAGADARIADVTGAIPLHHAYDSMMCLTLLIRAYPEGVYVCNKQMCTPLHFAAKWGTDAACDVLLKAGSELDVVNNDGYTPLCESICYRPAIAMLLIEHGARLENVCIEPIPDYAISFVKHREACRSASYAMLELARRRSRIIGGNRRDALGLVARTVWITRKNELWGRK